MESAKQNQIKKLVGKFYTEQSPLNLITENKRKITEKWTGNWTYTQLIDVLLITNL